MLDEEITVFSFDEDGSVTTHPDIVGTVATT
jgi:hypothetical protein